MTVDALPVGASRPRRARGAPRVPAGRVRGPGAGRRRRRSRRACPRSPTASSAFRLHAEASAVTPSRRATRGRSTGARRAASRSAGTCSASTYDRGAFLVRDARAPSRVRRRRRRPSCPTTSARACAGWAVRRHSEARASRLPGAAAGARQDPRRLAGDPHPGVAPYATVIRAVEAVVRARHRVKRPSEQETSDDRDLRRRRLLFVALPYVGVRALPRRDDPALPARPFTYSSLSSQFLENQHHFWAQVPFHYGILVVLAGHVARVPAPARDPLLERGAAPALPPGDHRARLRAAGAGRARQHRRAPAARDDRSRVTTTAHRLGRLRRSCCPDRHRHLDRRRLPVGLVLVRGTCSSRTCGRSSRSRPTPARSRRCRSSSRLHVVGAFGCSSASSRSRASSTSSSSRTPTSGAGRRSCAGTGSARARRS